MSFETATLESLCELVIDCPHSTPKWTDEGIIVLRNQNIKSGVLDLSSPSFTNEDDYLKRIKRAVPRAGDIVFTREAPMGEVCMVPEGLKCCLGQRQVLLRPKSDVNGQYLFWALQSPYVQQQIAWNEGTGSTVSNVRIPVLKTLNIPRIANEDMIAKSLTDISSKLSLNTQTNQTLEQMAQAIFKSWFVDFDPVKAKMNGEQPEGMDAATASLFPEKLVESELGLIPEGWSVKPLGDVSTFQNGYAFKSKELTTDTSSTTHKVFKMGNIRKGGGFNSKGSKDCFNLNSNPKVERYLIKKGDLLMSMTDMKNNVALLGHTALMPVSDEYLVNQRVGLIRKSDKHYLNYPFLYYQTNEPLFLTDIRSRANSGVQVNLSTKGIKDTLLVVPPKDIHEVFDKQIRSYLEKMFSNDAQSEELAKLRDLLLPKLLSGEIEL